MYGAELNVETGQLSPSSRQQPELSASLSSISSPMGPMVPQGSIGPRKFERMSRRRWPRRHDMSQRQDLLA